MGILRGSCLKDIKKERKKEQKKRISMNLKESQRMEASVNRPRQATVICRDAGVSESSMGDAGSIFPLPHPFPLFLLLLWLLLFSWGWWWRWWWRRRRRRRRRRWRQWRARNKRRRWRRLFHFSTMFHYAPIVVGYILSLLFSIVFNNIESVNFNRHQVAPAPTAPPIQMITRPIESGR